MEGLPSKSQCVAKCINVKYSLEAQADTNGPPRGRGCSPATHEERGDADLAQGVLPTGCSQILPCRCWLLWAVPVSGAALRAIPGRCSGREELLTPSAGRAQHTALLCFSLASLLPRFNDEEICTCPQVSVPQQFYSIPWNTFNRDVLKSLYGFAPISMHCNKSSAVRFPVGAASLPKLPSRIPRCKVGSEVLRTHPNPAGLGQGAGAAWKSLASAGHGAQHSPVFKQ